MALGAIFPTRTLEKHRSAALALRPWCMGMSEFYGHGDRAEALNGIAAALDAGRSLSDTGDFYGMVDSELLSAEARYGRRDKAIIQGKSGAQRGSDGTFIGLDTRRSVLKDALAY